MRSLLLFSSALLATARASTGVSLARRANIQDYDGNIIIVQDGLPGFFLDVGIGGNSALTQVDFQSADLYVTGKMDGTESFTTSNTKAEVSYSYFSEPVADTASIAQTSVSIGGKTIQQAFAWDANYTIKDLTEAFPEIPALGVLGFGPSPVSAVFNGLKTGHSPIDTLVSTNATNPYVTVFFTGSEPYNGTSTGPSFGGFFSVGEPVPLQDLLPSVGSLSAPDLSSIHNQTAISLSIDNSFPVQKISVGNTNVPLTSSVSGTSAGTDIGILSSVEPYILVPASIAQAIYGSVNGAALDSQTGLWHTPCGTNITVSVTIAGSTVVLESDSVVITLSGTSQCVGSFKVNSKSDQNWDISFGTAFLENVYVLLGYTATDLVQPIMKLLPYADIPGIDAYVAAFNATDGSTTTSKVNNAEAAPQTSGAGPSTRFTTVTVTHTPTTTVMVGGPSSSSASASLSSSSQASSAPSSSSQASTPTGTSSDDDKFAGALDVASSPTASSDSDANQLKIYRITTYALAGVSGVLLLSLIGFCIANSRRKPAGAQQSAYRSVHLEEAGEHSRALYGHDEESSKYSDPYQDRM